MERHIKVEYSGKCPSCGRYQSSRKPENVDTPFAKKTQFPRIIENQDSQLI